MSNEQPEPTSSVLAGGMIRIGGLLLLVIGVWQGFMGVVAMFHQTVYVVGPTWVASFDVKTWGWIHILLGLALFVTGIFLLRGAVWASVVAIICCSISAVANFMWLPHYPMWSILVIVMDVLIIWALVGHRDALHRGTD